MTALVEQEARDVARDHVVGQTHPEIGGPKTHNPATGRVVQRTAEN
jgi:hypothetical protein